MKDLTIKTNMTKNLKTITWDAPVADAASLMEDYRIRHLPVTDSTGAIIGIMSDRDVNKAMNPNRPGFYPGTFVKDFMSWPVVTVDENRSLKEVAEGMVNDKISAVLVTTGAKQVVGIVTTEDLLRFLIDAMVDEKKKNIFDFTYTPLVSELIRETQSVGI